MIAVSSVTRSVASFVALALATSGGAAAHMILRPHLVRPRPPLARLLNRARAPARPTHTGGGSGLLGGIPGALVLKPDLGACQSYLDACHEGAIVKLPSRHILQTMGAGLGLDIGGVRLEYAHGLRTGANFIGIRGRIP